LQTLLKLFFDAKRSTSIAMIACLLIASAVEGIGFTSAVPLLSVATGLEGSEDSPIMTNAREIMTSLNLPMSIGILLSFFIATMILKSLLTFLAMAYVGSTVAEFSTKLRLQIVKNIFNVRWSYFVNNPIGRITVAVGAQAASASEAYRLTATMIAGTIQSLAFLTVAFFISWPLALAAIAVGLFIVVCLHVLVRIARKTGIRLNQYGRELSIFLTDTLINIKPLRAMTRHSAFSHLLERKVNSLKKAMRRNIISKEGLKYGQEILVTLILGVGCYLAIIVWEIPIIELGVVGILLKKTTNNITKIQRTYQEAITHERPYIEVRELVNETAAMPEKNPGMATATLEQGCRLQDIKFSYDDKDVLHEVSLEIPARSITVLTGPSGSGKTTIADIILGLHTPISGTVLIDGKPLHEIELGSWRHLIGYVPQDLVLFHDTLHANLTLGDPDITDDDVRQALETAGAWDFINAMPEGIMSVAGQQGTKLSGGQRQRIAIARALVLKPRLLILDEVTSALDTRTEREICENIRNLSHDMTIFAITHRPALLEFADRVYAIKDGMVVEVTKEPAFASHSPPPENAHP
jgi:ATP-binding cassette subfamily C protein